MTHMEELYRILRNSHVQAQGIVDTVSEPLLVLDETLRVQTANRAFFETFQVDRDETIGQPLHELGNGQWNIADLQRLLVEVIPRAAAIINYEVEHEFPALGRRTMLLTARRLHHPDSPSRLMLLSILDVTERYQRDAAREMLFDELRHRMKNLLSVTQSIARQTSTENRTAEEYRDDFLGRFEALVDAQDLAFSDQGEGALSALVERVLMPYTPQPDAIVLESGSAIRLAPQTLQSLSLVLHELATNAAKYGALSVKGGTVRIGWQLEDNPSQLHLRWAENGGPPVTPPEDTGFGTRLIRTAIAYSLGGHVEQDYAQDGLVTQIVIPLGEAHVSR